WTARAIGGVQAGRWAAICAAALCISPLLGSYAINGELLAAPFVVLGLGCVVVSLRSEAPRQAFAYAATAGALALGALAIKQNFADVAVFGVVALVGALWRRDVTARRFVGLAEAGLGGAVLALLALVVWTWTHGTSPVGVFDATYPFRIHAGRVMAASGNQPAALRLHHLLVFALISGVVLLGSIVMADLVRRRRRCAVWWALLATLVFGVASVMVGGNYWRHYLIQLIGPMSVAIGVLAAQRRPAARLAVTYVVVAAVLAWVHLFSAPTGNIGTTIGSAVSRSAHPGDTIVTAWGHANVDQVSGLRSPYVHLWSLPTKTLDPKLEGLDAVLRGPDAPTYVIAWNHLRSWGLHTTLIQRIVAERYRPVAQLCGRTIYLLDGVDRPAPRLTTTCRGTRLAAS
ncbi:MAG: hypothetical protein JWP10_587, partial [Nocardioidaceae bacterium]|nr:hypothetical protein [Nocardioidaceae bacterium]